MISKVNDPPALGVPDSVPSALSESPGGNEPPVTANTIVPLPVVGTDSE